MVGRSTTIYRRICHVLVAGLKGSPAGVTGFPEAALCALRSQLLMALHDDNALHPTQPPFSFDKARFLTCRLPGDASCAAGRAPSPLRPCT